MFFSGAKSAKADQADFPYLKNELYFDSACQTLRPQAVLHEMGQYFKEYNACGGRVKYEWGEKVDKAVNATRQELLKFLGFSEKNYAAAFTLNTTYGINLVLQQMLWQNFESLVTSEIEHNSVFLPSITAAKKFGKKRLVLPRAGDGSLIYEKADLAKAVVLVNSTSNIDGRELVNLEQLVSDAHSQGGVVLLDAAQSMAHSLDLLKNQNVDALFGSAHKMYGPSLGFILIKKDLLSKLDISLVGGGTVSSVQRDNYQLIDIKEEPWARLELGLQNFSGIIGLGAAIDWLEDKIISPELCKLMFDGFTRNKSIHLINTRPSPIVSLYSDKADAHRLALYLSAQKVMVRSGYFCCHYYLAEVKKYPPLLRFSLGLHNTKEQVEEVVKIFNKIVENT